MYTEFLAQLLAAPDKTLKVRDTGVTTSAIRAGLNHSLTIFNQQMDLMELPKIEGRITVSTPTDGGVITIAVVTACPSKFSFTIVSPDGEGE